MAEQIIIKKTSTTLLDNVEELQTVTCGTHIQEFLDYQKKESGLDNEDLMNLRNSACDILTYCNPHDAVSNQPTTHLVVGYVQSGKTMSFTSVIKLALDNHYKVVIVLAGITTSLLRQTDERLGEDLVCGIDKNYRYFKLHKNPDSSKSSEIARNLKLKNSILVINVLKHAGRINNVTKIFLNEEIQKLLEQETVLIIDDEADQASLNNFGRTNSNTNDEEAQKMSSTYEAIFELRNVLPGNSYIQYTATPQANILIDTMDMLSPKTHTLLKPGKGYCGGKLFFGIGEEGKRFNDGLIITIPQDEVFNSKRNPLENIPDSLKDALMLHIWAVIINTRVLENSSQLSMMVHTDVTLDWNAQFYNWINETLDDWSKVFDEPGYGVKRFKLEEEFRKVYVEAVKFYPTNSFNYQDLKEYIPEILYDSHVYLITGDTNDMEELNWNQFSCNILVGAQMLNRGFTVKNLTTTYMPRYTIGETNADTIEQRCRFFGYKEKYIKSCRVFLPKVSIDHYIHYIDSEEELRKIMQETKSLEECGHKILSYPRLKPTRFSILPASVVTTSLKGMKELAPYNNTYIMESNRVLIDSFLKDYADKARPFKRSQYNYSDYNKNGDRVHSSFRVPVDIAIDLLKKLQFGSPTDKRSRADTIRYISYLKEKKLISDVEVINMSEGKYKNRTLDPTTHRLTSYSGKGSNIFNGPSSSTDKKHYLGDRAMYIEDTLTIQLHHLTIDNMSYLKTVGVAIYYPEKFSVKYTQS